MGRGSADPSAGGSSRRRSWSRRGAAWIEAELSEFLVGRETWPTAAELRRAGRGDLLAAITRNGGTAVWARRMDRQLRPEQTPTVRRWTDAEIEAQLRDFIGDSRVFPTRAQFKQAGLLGLRAAVSQYGGADYWRERLAVDVSPADHWTDDQLHAALVAFVGDADRFPTNAQLRAAGQSGLAHAINKHGGVRRWAELLELPLSPRQKRIAR